MRAGEGVVWFGPAELEHSSVVLWGSWTLVRRGHVVQVAAVLMPTVVQGLTFEKSRGRGEVGDWGHGEVVVGMRWGVLGCVRKVLLGCWGVWVMVSGA